MKSATALKPAKVRTKILPAPAFDSRTMSRVAATLKAVSDPTRVTILLATDESPLHVGAIVVRTGHSQPAVFYHLQMMTAGGLLERRRKGKQNIYSPTDSGRILAAIVRGLMSGQV